MLRTALVVSLGLSVVLCSPAAATETASRKTSEQCLACHDGSAAIPIRSTASHKWGVDYRAARALPRLTLREPTAPSGFGSTVANDLLVEGKVECTTCHFDHESFTETPFRLRMREGRQNTLCLACHVPR